MIRVMLKNVMNLMKTTKNLEWLIIPLSKTLLYILKVVILIFQKDQLKMIKPNSIKNLI